MILSGLRKTKSSFLVLQPLGNAIGTFHKKSGTLSHHAYRRTRHARWQIGPALEGPVGLLLVLFVPDGQNEVV